MSERFAGVFSLAIPLAFIVVAIFIARRKL